MSQRPEGYCGWRELLQEMRQNARTNKEISDEFRAVHEGYLRVAETICDAIDRGAIALDPALPPVRIAEVAALMDLLTARSRVGGAQSFRWYRELDRDARKDVITLLMLLPVLHPMAQRLGQKVLCIRTTASRASALEYPMMMWNVPFPLEVAIWPQIDIHRLRNRCFIADLDWLEDVDVPPAQINDYGKNLKRKMQDAIDAILASPTTSAVFIHHAGAFSVLDVAALAERAQQAQAAPTGSSESTKPSPTSSGCLLFLAMLATAAAGSLTSVAWLLFSG